MRRNIFEALRAQRKRCSYTLAKSARLESCVAVALRVVMARPAGEKTPVGRPLGRRFARPDGASVGEKRNERR